MVTPQICRKITKNKVLHVPKILAMDLKGFNPCLYPKVVELNSKLFSSESKGLKFSCFDTGVWVEFDKKYNKVIDLFFDLKLKILYNIRQLTKNFNAVEYINSRININHQIQDQLVLFVFVERL